MWQTRTVCTYVAATVPVDKPGAGNPLLDLAQQIGLEDTETDEQHDEPEQRKQPKVEPNVGTYEAFLATFGAPGRWSGR